MHKLITRVVNDVNQEKKLKFLQMQKMDINKEENVQYDQLKKYGKI